MTTYLRQTKRIKTSKISNVFLYVKR